MLVDGAPRVACVTPGRGGSRAGRSRPLDGLPDDERAAWADAFCATGASQCGFCTPGIIVRLAALRAPGGRTTAASTGAAAHLCRCTGWRTILEACAGRVGQARAADPRPRGRRAGGPTIEGGAPQRVGPDVALGGGGFADDTAPPDALVAVPDGRGGWAVGRDAGRGAPRRPARCRAGAPPSRVAPRSTCPPGDWDVTLRTSWVEPAYLETDASWCEPGGEPATPLANGGAFGGKVASPVAARGARRWPTSTAEPVRVLLSREDVVRLGPEAPADRRGRRGATARASCGSRARPGIAEAIAAVAPGLVVEEVDVAGPPTSVALRARGLGRGASCCSPALAGESPTGRARPTARVAEAAVDATTASTCGVDCGDPLDEVVLRSLLHRRRAHGARLGDVARGSRSTTTATLHDLTIRSFGILRAVDMPAGRGRDRPIRPAAGERVATRCSPRWRPPPGSSRVARRTGRPIEGATMMSKPVGPTRRSSAPASGWSCPARSASARAAWCAGGVEAELRQALANLRAAARDRGRDARQVVKTTVFLATSTTTRR